MAMTARQAEVLAFIRGYLEANGYPPTRSEIARHLGFRSLNAAESHLRALAKKRMIELLPGAARGIRIPDTGLPVIGRVAAGRPIVVEPHIERRIRVEEGLFRPRADYLLRVQGSSMRDAGILDRDLLAVHSTPVGRHGQIVVARLDDEVTVKRLYRRQDGIELRPENPEFEPIRVDLRRQTLVIEGIGVGVIRARSL
ncbi:MAG: transcriptional repressor LexA [Acidiferrobacteraceae bacterium]